MEPCHCRALWLLQSMFSGQKPLTEKKTSPLEVKSQETEIDTSVYNKIFAIEFGS